MSALGEAINAIEEILKIAEDVKRIGEAVKEISHELNDQDRRITRMEAESEAAVELSARGGAPHRLK